MLPEDEYSEELPFNDDICDWVDEHAALESQLVDLLSTYNTIKDQQAVCKDDIVSVESIFEGEVNINSFTKHPTQTNYTVSVESIGGAIYKAIKAVLKKMLAVFKKIMDWFKKVFSGRKDTKKLAELKERDKAVKVEIAKLYKMAEERKQANGGLSTANQEDLFLETQNRINEFIVKVNNGRLKTLGELLIFQEGEKKNLELLETTIAYASVFKRDGTLDKLMQAKMEAFTDLIEASKKDSNKIKTKDIEKLADFRKFDEEINKVKHKNIDGVDDTTAIIALIKAVFGTLGAVEPTKSLDDYTDPKNPTKLNLLEAPELDFDKEWSFADKAANYHKVVSDIEQQLKKGGTEDEDKASLNGLVKAVNQVSKYLLALMRLAVASEVFIYRLQRYRENAVFIYHERLAKRAKS